MKRIRILPYRPDSKSSRVLSKILNCLRVRFNGSFRPTRNHLVVNWGSFETPRWWMGGLNPPNLVRESSNKLRALIKLKTAGISVPEFTESQQLAQEWILNNKVVVGRKILNGHGGIGCIVWDNKDDHAEPCPLYTLHVRHKREFRIHVFDGQIIDQVEKLKRRGFLARNTWIRNHNNGYVFCRRDIVFPEIVRQMALKATEALGLNFGAVDVAYREKENTAFVLEVNTAPGVEGTTIFSYAKAIEAASCT